MSDSYLLYGQLATCFFTFYCNSYTLFKFKIYFSLYLDLLIYTIGDYDESETKQLSDIQTCVSKDLRPGFEGHDAVEISWKTHDTHGMYVHTCICVLFNSLNYYIKFNNLSCI